MARHDGATVCPARPYKPRDKAKVEQSVLLVERWVLARLRNTRFFSRAELNAAITALTADLKGRLMRGYGASRAELFAAVDAPALKPLPAEPYAFATWKRCRVAPDYHVEVEGCWYSVPYRLIRDLVDVRVTERTIEAFHKGERVASHARSPGRRSHVTLGGHMPSAHRRHASWTPARITAFAEKVGPATAALTQAIMVDRPHPEQGFRTCLGILSLEKTYGKDRLEAACQRGALIKARSVGSIRSILRTGLDRAFPRSHPRPRAPAPRQHPRPQLLPLTHHPQEIAMLTHPTHDRLLALGLPGMARAFQEQRAAPDLAALSFEERGGILADREAAERDTKRVTARLKSPPCARTPAWRTSTFAPRAASIARCWPGSSPVTGSTGTRTC